MNIADWNEYLSTEMPEVHAIALSKGFWETSQNKYEKLMLISSELGEALEADRKGRYANLHLYHDMEAKQKGKVTDAFEQHVKDSFEDEIADVVIRCLDYAAYFKLPIMAGFREFDLNPRFENSVNRGEQLFYMTGLLALINSELQDPAMILRRFMYFMLWLCENRWHIDLKKHIFLKKQYNKTRDKLHGKKY